MISNFKGRDDNRDKVLDAEIINPDTGQPYFSSSRFKIFHYVIIGYYQLGSRSTYGISDKPGDDIALWKQTIDTSFSYIEKHFMHELGHNLGLSHPSDNDNSDKIYTSMYQGRYSIANFGTSSKARDYNGDPIIGGDEWKYVSEHLDLFITRDIYD